MDRKIEKSKKIIGCEEWCSMPDIGIPAIKAKIDSGADISSINAYNIIVETSQEDGKEYAIFDVFPIQNDESLSVRCRAPIVGRRVIKSSNGATQNRIIVLININMAGNTWPIDVSLANRSSMSYRMLLGKEAMEGFFVDISQKLLLGKIKNKDLRQLYKSSKAVERRKLRVILLASNPELYSNRRIMEAFAKRSHDISFVDVNKCYIKVSQEGMYVFYKGKRLDGIDVVVPRFRPSVTLFGCSLLRQFAAAGTYCLNSDEAISNARNKLKSLQIMANKGVSIPVSAFANSPLDTEHLIDIVDGTPLIIKLLEGTQGKGVVLIDSKKSAKSVMDAFKSVKANAIVQRFVKEANGEDIRCFIIGGKIVASMKRKSDISDFRSNLHLGGKAMPTKLTKSDIKMAKLATRAIGLKVSGVDIVHSHDGSQVIEVNSSPGLEGIEKVSGLDIADMMVEFVEKEVTYIYDDSTGT